MNVLTYHVASGQAFFSGVALIASAVLLALGTTGRWWGLGRTVLVCAGGGLCAASGTPLPWWLWAVSGVLVAAWLGVEGWDGDRRQRMRRGLRWAVLSVLALGVAMEAPHHRMPRVPRLGNPPVEVVGDSLSAGAGESADRTWPLVLARRHRITVRNRAQAGATAASAQRQATLVTEPGALAIVAIGGNDVLGETAPAAFERALDILLAQLRT